MKFFITMIGFIILVLVAFYVGYKVDLAPVEDGSAPSDYGVGTSSEDSFGGIRTGGSSTSTQTSFGAPKKQNYQPSSRCLDGARC